MIIRIPASVVSPALILKKTKTKAYRHPSSAIYHPLLLHPQKFIMQCQHLRHDKFLFGILDHEVA